MRKLNIKHIALSIVAFVLILILTVGVTFSWIDDVKLVEFKNDDLVDDGAPLKTGVDINSDIKITSETNNIDLGYMLEKNDLTYTYTDNETTKRHIKYDGGSNGPDSDYINENKGYFYESGDMHLSGCYSDGETFYFPRQGTSGYREGNKDDENVNYISFTTRVSSPNANIDFWFRKIPTICEKNSDNAIANARYAIIVDGECHVYSSTGDAQTISDGSTSSVTGVRKTANYTYKDSSNTTTERGRNSNTLFSIAKGDTVNLTVKIWLEDGFDTNITASDIDFQLVSSWAYNKKIWVEDKTTNGNGGSWLDDDSAKLYVTFPDLLKDINSDVSEWSDYKGKFFFPLTKDTSTGKYYADVPLVFNNEKMALYRCISTGWNKNKNGSNAAQRSDYNVYCWNWWQTYTPNTYENSTYTLYGGSMDSTANGYFNSIGQGFTVTDKGYGTWGGVEKIKVNAKYNNNDLASKSNGKAMYVVDYSDEDTSQEKYIYEMYRSGTSDSWETYVPAGSAKIQFRYFGGASGLSWGYNSWNRSNPQMRPLASTGLYTANAKTYQLGAIFSNTKGWGFWQDDTNNIYYDKVYVVKNGTTLAMANNVYAYMYDDNGTPNENHAWHGIKMTRMKDASNNDVTWKDNSSPVMQSDPARQGVSTIFNHLIFNDGGNNQMEKVDVFPGCFYDPEGKKWYGSIEDKGRTATEQESGGSSGGDSSGTDTGGGSMSGYTSDSKFVFKVDGNNYYAKTNGTDFKVRVNLASGDNWTTVQYQEGNYPNYGNVQAGQYYVPKDGVNLYLSAYNSNNFSIRTNSSGSFIVSFEYENGNTNKIKITSILKED